MEGKVRKSRVHTFVQVPEMFMRIITRWVVKYGSCAKSCGKIVCVCRGGYTLETKVVKMVLYIKNGDKCP